MTETRSYLSARLTFGGLMDSVFAFVACSSWIGLLGGQHWLADLFSHFRWQYLILGVLGVSWCLWRKRSRWLLGLSLLSLGLNVGEMYKLMGQPDFAVTEGRHLRVISLNLLSGNPHKQEVLDYLHGVDADVIFLAEVDAEWGRALDSLKSSHPYSSVRYQHDNYGVALFSRLPLTGLRVLESPGSDIPSLLALLRVGTCDMAIVGAHPPPPLGRDVYDIRNAVLQNIAAEITLLKVPVLLVGDLNSTPWCQGMRILKTATKLDFRSPDPAWMPTWEVGTPFALPIDHALCTPPLVVARRGIGPSVGSDHRPQELEIGWAL